MTIALYDDEYEQLHTAGVAVYTNLVHVTRVANRAVTIQVTDHRDGQALIALDLESAERLVADVQDRLSRAMQRLVE